MKKVLFTIAALASIASFAKNVTGPYYRLEGELGFPFRIGKVEEIVTPAGSGGTPPAVTKMVTKIWGKETDLRISFVPEWKYEITDKIDLVFGPKISLGDKILTQYKFEKEIENTHGILGSVGGEVNVDFALPNSDTKVFIGLGLTAGGYGYFDFNDSPKVLGGGHVVNADFLIGTKLSDKIRLALSLGYENTGVKTKNDHATDEDALGLKKDAKYDITHSFRPGVRFSYLLGE